MRAVSMSGGSFELSLISAVVITYVYEQLGYDNIEPDR